MCDIDFRISNERLVSPKMGQINSSKYLSAPYAIGDRRSGLCTLFGPEILRLDDRTLQEHVHFVFDIYALAFSICVHWIMAQHFAWPDIWFFNKTFIFIDKSEFIWPINTLCVLATCVQYKWCVSWTDIHTYFGMNFIDVYCSNAWVEQESDYLLNIFVFFGWPFYKVGCPLSLLKSPYKKNAYKLPVNHFDIEPFWASSFLKNETRPMNKNISSSLYI